MITIAIFQEGPGFAGGKLERIGAAICEFEQAALILFFRSGDGAAPDQVALNERSAVVLVMRDHLVECPVQGNEVTSTHAHGRRHFDERSQTSKVIRNAPSPAA